MIMAKEEGGGFNTPKTSPVATKLAIVVYMSIYRCGTRTLPATPSNRDGRSTERFRVMKTIFSRVFVNRYRVMSMYRVSLDDSTTESDRFCSVRGIRLRHDTVTVRETRIRGSVLKTVGARSDTISKHSRNIIGQRATRPI